MESINVNSIFSSFQSPDQLASEDQKLLNKAIDARDRAYAPYSGFSVGAAVLLDNGTMSHFAFR